jgi:hypothetical protein
MEMTRANFTENGMFESLLIQILCFVLRISWYIRADRLMDCLLEDITKGEIKERNKVEWEINTPLLLCNSVV